MKAINIKFKYNRVETILKLKKILSLPIIECRDIVNNIIIDNDCFEWLNQYEFSLICDLFDEYIIIETNDLGRSGEIIEENIELKEALEWLSNQPSDIQQKIDLITESRQLIAVARG